MTVFIIISVSAMNIICFLSGVLVALRCRGEVKTINPVTVIKDFKKQKAQKSYEKDMFDTLMRNIDAYDGTSANQKDVPIKSEGVI